MSSYLPTTDALLDPWASNWSTKVTASPTTYGLTAPIAVTVAALFATWHAAYLAAIAPTTRSPTTIAAKDSAKGAMVPILRLYSQQVKANDAISNANKEALGIHIDDTTPTPVPPPSTHPIITVVSSGPQVMRLRFADEATPDSRKRPFGVPFCLLFRKIGVAPVVDPAGAEFVGAFSRIPFDVAFDAGDQGKTCTFFAQWANTKGEEGPWSAPTSRIIT